MHENRQKVYLLSGNVGQRINWEMSRNCLSESRAANSKQPFVYERLPQGQGFLAVDLQHADRRAADSGAADEHRAVIAEMVRPFVAAGMDSLVNFLVSGSNPEMSEPLKLLQYQHAFARFEAMVDP